MAVLTYRPDVDGLRAIAVLVVILFHAGMSGFPGGYIGVDIFFVISGFLITSIIKNLDAGRFSFVHFSDRRTRRILPALFVITGITAVFSWLWMTPIQFERFSYRISAVSVFLSNVLFLLKSGYFAAGGRGAHGLPLARP